MHHPAIGIRIPEIYLPGIIAALQKYNTAAGLELSFGRETSLEKVVNAPSGEYPISLGHTGTSISAYVKAGDKAAKQAGIPVELEADHLIIIGSQDQAIKRIEGVFEERKIDPAKLKESFNYNFSAINEAAKSADVRCFTTDTSDLIWHGADKLERLELERELHDNLSERGRRRLFNRYMHKKFVITDVDGSKFTIEFDREKVLRLFLKYMESIRGNARLYDYIRVKKISSKSFGFEISMDETQELTPLEDVFFYLMEWTQSNRHVDYFAPNIGFRKRADYTGSLNALIDRVKKVAAVASYFDETIISFHSGSGSTPWSGKGEGVYPVLVEATGTRLKYKISGVYSELLFELLARGDAGKPGKDLYNEIFDRVFDYCLNQVETKGELSSDLLKKQLVAYEKDVAQKKIKPRDPRADFFRFNSWLALAFRDGHGKRIYREKLVSLYKKDSGFRRQLDQEVFGITERLITGLKFEANC
jgi:hypothetical protein